MSGGYPCQECGTQLQWVAQYNQYYCPHCQKYIPAQAPAAPAAPAAKDPVDKFFGGISRELGLETTPCPTCGRGATYSSQYSRWYCGNCQRWL